MNVSTHRPPFFRADLAAERAVVAVLAAVTAAFALLDLHTPVRTLVTFGFLLVCPGLGLAHMTRISDRTSVLVTAVATSLAFDTLLAEAMAYTKAWSPDAALAVLILVALFVWPRAGNRGVAR